MKKNQKYNTYLNNITRLSDYVVEYLRLKILKQFLLCRVEVQYISAMPYSVIKK
jgi:hypothetical protein